MKSPVARAQAATEVFTSMLTEIPAQYHVDIGDQEESKNALESGARPTLQARKEVRTAVKPLVA